MITIPTFFTYFINILVAYFFIGVVAIPKGYNHTSFLLVLIAVIFSLFCIVRKYKLTLSKPQKNLLFALTAYFLIYSVMMIIHQDKANILDNPSRGLLFFTLIFLFQYIPLSLNTLLISIPIGAVFSGVLALYQKYILGYERALSHQMVIQTGDMAMSLGLFSFAIALYLLSNKKFFYATISIIASILGILASILSGSRGGWLIAPFIIIGLLYSYRDFLSKKWLTIFLGALLISITLISLPKQSIVRKQLDRAYIEVINYGEKHNSGTSVGARLEVWKATSLAIQEKPIIGWGKQGYRDKRTQQTNEGILSKVANAIGHAHNQYLNDLAERGIIGLIGLMAIFIVPIIFFIRIFKNNQAQHSSNRLIAILGIVHILSVMSYGLTQVFFTHNSGSVFYFFIVAILYCLMGDES